MSPLQYQLYNSSTYIAIYENKNNLIKGVGILTSDELFQHIVINYLSRYNIYETK